jgi:hypothetical protein
MLWKQLRGDLRYLKTMVVPLVLCGDVVTGLSVQAGPIFLGPE